MAQCSIKHRENFTHLPYAGEVMLRVKVKIGKNIPVTDRGGP
jgi:hypothetical protein